ncbi:serine hydrolase [Streptomyces flavidovirens]|uniref:Serine hydrolase n=1 Tax=Streptomyces flavidovirens TaxID=67298 RepID=A0ABW6RGN6_9ACTN
MAGESPDKSEQRKSSGETAPGERDPRIAVFRESAARPEPEGSDRVDQPTAVFKLPPEEPSPDPETPETPKATETTPEGDARLRAAVAAWVATTDDEGSGEDRAPEAGGDGARAAAAAEAGPGDGRSTAAAEKRPDAAERPAGAPDPDEKADQPSPAGAGASGAGRAGGRAAVDAEARGDGRTSDTAEPAAEPLSSARRDDPEAPVSSPDEAEDTPGPDTGPRGGTDGSGAGREGDRAAARADGAPKGDVEARSTSDGSGAGRKSDRAAARPEGASEGDAGARSGSDGSGTGREGGRAGVGKGDAGARSGSGLAGGGSLAVAGGDEPSETAVAGGDESSGSGDAKSRGAEQAGGGVDQATAVFKAVRPRQAVDEPTTALKAVSKPESAAERTSKFVPLKRDDVRPPAGRPRSTPAASSAPAQSPAPAPAPAPASASAALPEAERTRQQPLPPKPPLDLLAELTNTPPPPETPVRTAVRRVKIWAPLLVLLVIIFAVVQFLRPLPSPTLALTAKPTYTFDGDALSMPWPEQGQSAVEVQGVGSIGTHGDQKPAPIASVAKTMTAYVILKGHPLKGNETGPKITVDAQAEKESKYTEESIAPIKEGQQFTERQMLQLLMVPSGNNAARLLARWDAKSEEEFVKKMNDAAKDLGMKNTTYTDPSGLEATTVSTATDQLKLAKAVMENDVFREIVNLPEVEIPGIDGKIYNNNNILLQPGVSGIKTGSSTPAGGNLLWSANTVVDGKERRIVGAVMGQEDATTLDGKLQLAISRSLKLIQAAQRDVTSATVVKKGDVVGYVDDGLGGQTPVVATKDLKAVGWPGLKVELTISDAGKPLPHAAKAGDEVGQVTVGSGPGQVKAPVALQKDLVEPGFGDKLTRVG